jgi:hypothetical protein
LRDERESQNFLLIGTLTFVFLTRKLPKRVML